MIYVNTSTGVSRLPYARPKWPTDPGGLSRGTEAVRLNSIPTPVSIHHQSVIANPVPTTIFIVDDDAAVRAGLSLLVRSCGWEPRAFASAEEFLDCYQPEPRACLLLDLQMPGIDGPGLQQVITDRNLRLPTIVVTAHKDEPLAARALAAGALAVVAKPFRNEELLQRIEDALNQDG